MSKRSGMVERDLGWKKISRAISHAGMKPHVLIGIQADEKGTSEEGVPIVEYAFYNEFGSQDGRRPPERSFIRSTSDEKRPQWDRLMARMWNGIIAGRVDIRTGLGIAGQQAEKDIKRKIVTLRTPGNAESTKEAKQSTNPLIDEGAMLGAIRHEVKA